MLPDRFTALDSLQMDALSKKGEKVVKETFDTEAMKGWQQVCFNLQDSLKRTILMSAITVKEAVAQNGSVDKFMDKVFDDGNNLMIQRLNNRVGVELDETKVFKRDEITIAGFRVKRNTLNFVIGRQQLFFARYYFFEKKDKLYFLVFFGSPRAKNNEEIANAIESGKAL